MAAIPTILKGDDSGAIALTLATGRTYTGATLVVAYQGITRTFKNLTPGGTVTISFTHEETGSFQLGCKPILMRLIGSSGAVETVENAEMMIKVTDCLGEVNAGGSFSISPSTQTVPVTDVGDLNGSATVSELYAKVNEIVRVLARRSLLSVALLTSLMALGSVKTATLGELDPTSVVVTNVYDETGSEPWLVKEWNNYEEKHRIRQDESGVHYDFDPGNGMRNDRVRIFPGKIELQRDYKAGISTSDTHCFWLGADPIDDLDHFAYNWGFVSSGSGNGYCEIRFPSRSGMLALTNDLAVLSNSIGHVVAAHDIKPEGSLTPSDVGIEIGYNATAYGPVRGNGEGSAGRIQSIAIGYNATASNLTTIAIGSGGSVAYTNVAGVVTNRISNAAVADGPEAIAIGYDAKARGDDALAVGVVTRATAFKSTAVGSGAISSGSRSSAFGTGSEASGTSSTAVGDLAIATNDYATAVGRSTVAGGDSSLAAGRGATATGANSVSVGYVASASRSEAVAVGHGATANGLNSIAIGKNAKSNEEDALAIGNGAVATNNNATSYGSNAQAKNKNATAVGRSSQATGSASSSIGTGSIASGESSTAVGYIAKAMKKQSTSIGYFAVSDAQQAVQIGLGTNTVEKSLKFRDTTIVGSDGKVPFSSLSGAYPASSGNLLATQVSTLGAHINAEDARFVSTNFNSETHMPEAYVEVKLPDQSWSTVWREMTRWNWLTDTYLPTNYASKAELDEKADRAWGAYDSETGAWAPDGYTWISSQMIAIAGNLAYQRTVTSEGSVWVLESNGTVTETGILTNGFFRISDDAGNTQFEIVKGDKRTLGADPSSCQPIAGFSPTKLSIGYSIQSDAHPTIYVTASLTNQNWKAENDADCIANVTWSGSSGSYVAYVQGKADYPSLFVKAEYQTGGETYIRNAAPVSMTHIMLNGTKYAVGTATISGNTVLTLTPAP